MDWEPLIAAASAVRANSYSPYSGFPVGAALLMEDGSIWAAANVENCIPTLAVCAERVTPACNTNGDREEIRLGTPPRRFRLPGWPAKASFNLIGSCHPR